jgi:chromosomal replication initiator protein
VVDYLAEIPLPGRILAAPSTKMAGRAASATLPFVAGPENRLVAATLNRMLTSASIAPASDTARGFSPRIVALFGPSGVGKTHLARGLVEHWQKKLGADSAHYTTAADFRRQFTEAIDTNRVVDFRNQCRGRRMLAIDDLHRLPSTDFLIQELRYTLDAFDENGGIIVVTSHRPADTLANLPPDIHSRLACGLSLQLAPPSNAARVRIIRHASTALGRELSEGAANRMAEGVTGSTTQVFGALFDLWSAPHINGSHDAHQTDQLLAARAPRRPTLPEIVAVVARYTNIPQKQLKSGSRKQSIVFARAIVVYLARKLAAASYDQIGRALGGRDHTTIMHNYKKIDRELTRDLAAQETVTDLRRLLLSR